MLLHSRPRFLADGVKRLTLLCLSRHRHAKQRAGTHRFATHGIAPQGSYLLNIPSYYNELAKRPLSIRTEISKADLSSSIVNKLSHELW